MCTVEFFQEESCFLLNKGGESIPFPYIPNVKQLLPNLKDESFDIFLLNNPFLHKEVNWYELRFDGADERGGFLFPISLLESEEVNDKYLLSYMFVAYRQLLLKINLEPTGVLSDSFPDAYVLAIHKLTKPDFRLEKYILSLAHYGFYDYKGKIQKEFPKINCIENQTKIIRLEESVVDFLQIKYVKDLLFNRLCLTADFLTRFVLIYQIVELYISEIHHNLLDDSINKYKSGELTRNDFSEKLKEISKESNQIKELVKYVLEEKVCREYIQEAHSLFNDINHMVKHDSLDSMLYALRNQLFHNYDLFDGHEDALNQVIFRFERVILILLSKKDLVHLKLNNRSADIEDLGNEKDNDNIYI